MIELLWVLGGCSKADPHAPAGPNESAFPTDSETEVLESESEAAPSGFFPAGAPWTEDISGAAVDPDSDLLIDALQLRGWGLGRFQMDWSLEVLDAVEGTVAVPFVPTGDFYSPDCDLVPMPLPEGGNVEGEDAYACLGDGDCHLLVRAPHEQRLYEMWRADVQGEVFRGGCLAVWDLSQVYPPEGRGDQCTSADAAGYPIAPLLATADEVATGVVPHALRFILPNTHIRDGSFHHPATHATNAEGGGADAIPYGARLRLRADFDRSRVEDPDALVIVDALLTYGMFLADGGSVTLTVQSDRRSAATWDELFAEDGSHALESLEPRDFEVVALDAPEIPLTYDCRRTPLTEAR